MKRTRNRWVTAMFALVTACVWAANGMAAVTSFTGTYKEALRAADTAGKPVMLDFYTDWCPHCKVMDRVVAQIPDMMSKFIYYRVNAERYTSLAKQFNVKAYPTVVFVKPNGDEFHRWTGSYDTAKDTTEALQDALQKAGDIKPLVAAATTSTSAPATGSFAPSTGQSSAQETAAAAEFRMVQTYASMGRNDSAIKACQHILEKYPDTQAAVQAREKLAALGGSPP